MRKMFVGLAGGAALMALAAASAWAAPKRPASRPPARAAAPVVGPITGPVAEYWVSADTTSGFGAGLAAGGARPSMGSVLGMMAGRNSGPSHGLTLQLGSTRATSGPPQADAFVPAALGVGSSLPLVSPAPPAPGRAEPAEPGTPESYQRPRGRLIIYWGCGEHVGPGQPVVFDFSTIGTGAPLPDIGAAFTVAQERPPSPSRATTYGSWPNSRRQVSVPANGSLAGSHQVRGSYSPDIAFEVGPDMDFMPPMQLQNLGPTGGGGRRMTWSPAAQATGHHLMLIGANVDAQGGGGRGRGGGGRGESVDMVFWSSSSAKPGIFAGGLSDYIAPAEVRRLIGVGAILPPQTQECTLPAEVAQASPMGLVSAISYGPEQGWTDPPRPARGPWDIRWRAKLRLKSTATLILGMPGMGGSPAGGGRGRPGAAPPAPVDPTRELLRRFRPF